MKRTLLSIAIAGLCANAQAATPSMEEMWQMIQAQKAEIERLKGQLTQTDKRLATAEVKVEATADAVEQGGVIGNEKIAKLAEWASKTSLGGYGELHYNNTEKDDGSSEKDAVDFHRFVLFVNHQFNDKVRLFTELELEHSLSGDGKPGEVELEQAYIEWDLSEQHRAKAGLFLLPVGILNETHEPDTFYGVERNNVEKNIIPTTWWEAGLGLGGEIAEGLSYDVAVHSGLKLAADEYKPRDGRQKVASADANNFAYTGRIKYTGVPGLELAATVQYQTDVYQSNPATPDVDATLFEAHAAYQKGPFAVRALYAQWNFDDSIETIKVGADKQQGFYIEPSFRINEKVGIFARYSEWDNLAGSSVDTEIEQFDIGINYWLTESVVFKADYQNQDAKDESKASDGFNLGVGYSF